MQRGFAQIRTAGHQPPTCAVRVLESPAGAELYVTAAPGDAGAIDQQADEMYAMIARALRRAGARIVQERLFASAGALSAGLSARVREYGDLDDGLLPTLLALPAEREEFFAGAQVHAVSGVGTPRVLGLDGVMQARAFECAGCHYLAASGLQSSQHETGPAQTGAALEMAASLLGLADGKFQDVARTWFWMDDILTWYPQFNEVRTRFFGARGLLRLPGTMPASTGIGVPPADPEARVAIDLFAAWGSDNAVTRFHAAGKQNPAFEYGSAFARAARAKTPGGTTVFCSGTAAIDAQGRSCSPGDIPAQIRMTLDNVSAVLREMDCRSSDVVQALAYCASPEVLDCFNHRFSSELRWPCLSMIGDVCRADLLFELEVTACRGARRPGG